jgi:hypothetical protein
VKEIVVNSSWLTGIHSQAPQVCLNSSEHIKRAAAKTD